MNKRYLFGGVASLILIAAVAAWAANPACNINNCKEQGGDRWSVGGSIDVLTGGDLDMESGSAFKLAGTTVSATAAELDAYTLVVELDTLCTASSAWVVAPHAGDITKIYTVIDGAIITANAVLDPQIGGVSITNGGVTVAFSSSAAGDVDSSTPTAANTVTAGQAIEIATDGACANAIKTEISILIAR